MIQNSMDPGILQLFQTSPLKGTVSWCIYPELFRYQLFYATTRVKLGLAVNKGLNYPVPQLYTAC